MDALRAYKGKLLEAKLKGLSARQIHQELSKNLSFHITYKALLAVLHEAEEELRSAAAKEDASKTSAPIVSKRTRSRPK